MVNGQLSRGQFAKMREKVEQWCRDVWRPYHGSTRHRQEDDANQMVEKKKVGGHMPLNTGVMAFHDPEPGSRQEKLRDSRELFMRELYRLAAGSSLEVVCFAEIQDLFGRYGAGDSDYAHLKEKAEKFGPDSQSASKLAAVDLGIDLITQRLMALGVTGRDFWADFAQQGFSATNLASSTAEKDRQRYLAFVEQCDRLRVQGFERYRTAALKAVAAARGEAVSTIQAAVAKIESGYIYL